MSSQSFSSIVRESIHKVFNKKCHYCSGNIEFHELEIDHLVPESLLNNDDKRVCAYEMYGLSSSFDILSYENLVASCNACNNKKNDLLLHAGYVAITLAVIKSKLPKLNEYLSEAKRKRKLASILKSIAHSVDAGTFTEKDIIEGLGYNFSDLGNTQEFINSRPEKEDPSIDNLDILWTRHAQEKRIYRDIPIEDVIEALSTGVTYHSHSEHERYFVETASGLRVVYQIRDETILIISCYKHNGGNSYGQRYKRIDSPIKK